jgi:hypothetical protein
MRRLTRDADVRKSSYHVMEDIGLVFHPATAECLASSPVKSPAGTIHSLQPKAMRFI